jgi:hypothetical protein
MLLSLLSVANGAYTFLRKRHYRLFECPIDDTPGTPSAHRVRVDSSPISSSPLRFLSGIVTDSSAASRSHPDQTRDVWEVALWDPLPVCLRLFCLLSPGHIMVYMLFLPIAAHDPRPSTTVLTTVVLQILLSAQLFYFQTQFSRQIKDTALIQKEVLNEYDTKFVHPRLAGRPSRDVATQINASTHTHPLDIDGGVDTYTPAIVLKRSFMTNPNPHYASYISPDNPELIPKRESAGTTGSPFKSTRIPTIYSKPSVIRHPNFKHPITSTTSPITSMDGRFGSSPSPRPSSRGGGDGGSLGIFSHANSPLKKAVSLYDLESTRIQTPKNGSEAAAREIALERERGSQGSTSPMKNDLRRRTALGSMSSGHGASANVVTPRNNYGGPKSYY